MNQPKKQRAFENWQVYLLFDSSQCAQLYVCKHRSKKRFTISADRRRLNKMKVQDLNEAQGFATEVLIEFRQILKWKFFTSFACFYLAYLMANFTLGCYLLCGVGLALLIANYNSLLVSLILFKSSLDFHLFKLMWNDYSI